MGRFTLEIETGNAAFEGDWRPEVGALLVSLPNAIARGDTRGPLRDHNGNTVGHWVYTEED